MGNVPSSESPEGGRMAPHKLSKPRTTNVTTAGLTSSVPHGASLSSSPVPMPPMPPLPHAGDFDQTEPAARPEGASRTLSVKSIFRSRSSKGVTKRPGRTNSVGPLMPSPSPVPSTRPTRANSMVVDGSGHYAQTAGWPTTGASSFNYDPTSYEAKRLSYLMETPIYIEDLSMMSDTQTTGSRRNSHSEANPAYSSTAAVPRASSDMSLYTPMRRRSLLTPGLATRASPTPPVPRKSRNRYSMPSTPSRRDSFDGLEIGMFAMRPSSAVQPESIPRAATPSDDEYAQTGAFKLGTLRITNGSPVTSPSSHVEAESSLASGIKKDQDYFQQPRIPELGAEPSKIEEGTLHATHLTPGYLPQICVSPIRLDEVKMEDVEGLQTTSKTTAVEDDLFEVEQPDSPKAEVLDVRVDPSAKSHPRPKLAAGAKHSKDIGRSDSGVVASPTSECSQQSLSKADSGYSSNVSLRSFSKPLAAKKAELASKSALDTPPDTPHKESAVLQMPMSASPDLVDSSSSREGTPPLVQEKEQQKDTPGRHNMWSRGRTAFSKRVKNSAPSAINPHSQISALQAPEPSPLSPTSSIMSRSSLSSITRRNGKLHRFLSSGRKPHEAQAPSQPEETDVPTASQAVEASFADHVGPLPLPRKRWDLRAEPSKETLGTIMSVGSAEFDHSPTSHREVVVPSTRKPRNDGQCTATSAALQSATKPTVRKHVPICKSMTTPQQPSSTSPLATAMSPEPEATAVPPKQVSAVGGRLRTATTSSLARSGLRKSHVRQRSSTLNAQIEKDLSMRYSVSSNITSNVAANEVPPVSQAEIANKRIRSPPPVSMRTRNNGDFVKPPTRAQSTPPAAMRQLLSRKPSREVIQSYPSVVSQEPSREAIHGYPPVAEAYRGCAPVSPTMPHLNRRLSVVVNTESGSFRRPNWDVQPEHHSGTCSGTSSVDQSRHNSLTSQTNAQMRVIARPKLVPLHHRYSYDGYSLQQFRANGDAVLPETEEILIRDNGPYPSMLHKDGQEYVTDPWSGRPMPQVLGNQGRYPPYVPRGHFRNRSMGADQHPAPYRVLHSYNSPAYKNAPIWG
ncbi:uncharacterized protein PG986_002993 [Apiospora aurea]|uniref:Proteophosphoglycan ppg4 n=1 Tax=Apiospora aurea TaxID=335848 RepID=A0ABR1QQD8_9PEZI